MFFWNTYPRFAFFPFLIGFFVLDAILKAISLWNSARSGQRGWFIALFVLNTAGILPIIYLLFFRKKTTK